MKTISTKAIVAMMTATIGLGAIAPALAQTATATPDSAVTQTQPQGDERGFRPGGHGPGQRGGMAGFLDFGRGGEAIEIAIVRLSHAIDLTDEQTALLDTLKTTALGAAEDFATATEGLRATPPAEGETPTRPDMATALTNRIAFEKAQLAALEAVEPAATAFFSSLTEEQKAALMPQPGEGRLGGRGGQQMGQQHDHGPKGHMGQHGMQHKG